LPSLLSFTFCLVSLGPTCWFFLWLGCLDNESYRLFSACWFLWKLAWNFVGKVEKPKKYKCTDGLTIYALFPQQKGVMKYMKMSLQVSLTEKTKGWSLQLQVTLQEKGSGWDMEAGMGRGMQGCLWERGDHAGIGAIEHPDGFLAACGYFQRDPYATLEVWLRDKYPLLPHSKLSSTKRCSTLALQVICWRPVQAVVLHTCRFLPFHWKGWLWWHWFEGTNHFHVFHMWL